MISFKGMGRFSLATAAATALLWLGASVPAQATPLPECGYFSGYSDCGGGGSSDMGPFQPAPEKPWKYPTEPPPVPDTGPLFPWPERAPKPDKPQKDPQPKQAFGGGGCSLGGILSGAC